MSQRSLEIVAETVKAAVDKGLRKLGVSAAQVIVEVLEEPSAGLFGVGARPARVRLNTMAEEAQRPRESSSAEATTNFDDDQYILDDFYADDGDDSPSVSQDDGDFAEEEETPFTATIAEIDESEWDEEITVARDVMNELLEQMSLRANLRIGRAGEEEKAPWLLSLEGQSTSKLVGRRGEALAALQFLARLIVSKRIGKRCTFVLDADNYKMRRTDKLHALAERMANQATLQRRTVTLEPMPPNERRVIHIALLNREDVETISVGEGDGRKVTITPR